jgi:hypothetical protein
MKWLFIILLLLNVVYLGWEIDRDTQLKRANVSSAVKVPSGTQKLVLLNELDKLPETRSHIKLDDQLSMENYNSEPVMPIELNPNTEQMMDSLLTDTTISQLADESVMENQNQESFSLSDYSNEQSVSETQNTVCYTYGPIPNKEESDLLSKWLDERSIVYKERQTDEKGRELFWVYLTPRESREQAVAAMKDLKQKGVKDMRLIREGDLLNAISLGLFSSQASINRRLNEIKTKGYQSVVVPYSGGKKVHWFDVSVVQNSDYVNDLFTGFPARFKALPVECNAIAMR